MFFLKFSLILISLNFVMCQEEEEYSFWENEFVTMIIAIAVILFWMLLLLIVALIAAMVLYVGIGFLVDKCCKY